MTYRIDPSALTVIVTHDDGEDFDLNAEGQPCADTMELRHFVRELMNQGAYDDEQAGYLLSQIVDIDEAAAA